MAVIFGGLYTESAQWSFSWLSYKQWHHWMPLLIGETEISLLLDMAFHLIFLQFDYFFLTFMAFMNILGMAWLFYPTFTDVIECRDFTVIFPIFPRSYHNFADFYCDFLAALSMGMQQSLLLWPGRQEISTDCCMSHSSAACSGRQHAVPCWQRI